MKPKNINQIILTVLIIIILLPFVSAYPSDNYRCSMMNGFYGNYGNTAMYLSWITFILFIALILAAIYWLIKSANGKK